MSKVKRSNNDNNEQSWMNTYADLVTLLLCFFVLLFSMSNIDLVKFKALLSSFDNNIDLLPGGQTIDDDNLINNGVIQIEELATYKKSLDTDEEQSKLEENKKIADEISKELEGSGVDEIDITYTAQYVLLSLSGATLFDSAEAQIKQESMEMMEDISRALSRYMDYTISIEGHTDNRPINTYKYPSNMYLSSSRAISVYEYLVNEKGFSKDKLFAVGYGEHRPIADNNTPEGRAKNRRVEIKIINSVNK